VRDSVDGGGGEFCADRMRILFVAANKEVGFKRRGSCLPKIKLRELQYRYFRSMLVNGSVYIRRVNRNPNRKNAADTRILIRFVPKLSTDAHPLFEFRGTELHPKIT
jgi:hypothetical protein